MFPLQDDNGYNNQLPAIQTAIRLSRNGTIRYSQTVMAKFSCHAAAILLFNNILPSKQIIFADIIWPINLRV